MTEYISRDTAIARLTRLEVTDKLATMADAKWEIADMPAADVTLVRHGRWDDSYDGITPYCTVCGCSHRLMVRTPKYCPNCGAKMDGETEDNDG